MELKHSYKQTEVGVIPKDWDVKPLIDVVDFLDGRRRPVKDTDRAKMRGSIPYYGASGIVDYVNDYLFDEELVLLGEDGENILSRNCRLAFRVSGKVWVNNHAHVLKPKDGNDIGYIAEFLESINYEQYNTGTAQPKLNKQVCSSIPVVTPPPVEQRAIATALSDVDALLTAQNKLISKKLDIKQAAMQQLLTGKQRLPGFAGEWEVKRLGDVFNISAGKSKSAYIATSGRYWIVDMGSVSTAGKLIVSKLTNFEGDFLKLGDLVMPKDDIGGGGIIGRVGYIDADETYVLGDHVYRLMANMGDSLFLSYLINAHTTNTELRKKVIGSAQLGLGRKSVDEQEIPFPSLEEQSAIAAVLFDMDADLTALEQQRDKTRALKQGMMQELLTGRIRLV
jgi:type I restriction enzyme S subunit